MKILSSAWFFIFCISNLSFLVLKDKYWHENVSENRNTTQIQLIITSILPNFYEVGWDNFKCLNISWYFLTSLFSPVSSTNKTVHHNITEILLKVTINTINPTLPSNRKCLLESKGMLYFIINHYVVVIVSICPSQKFVCGTLPTI
jgi:amino acid transporter